MRNLRVIAVFVVLLASIAGCRKNHPGPANPQAPIITVPLSPTPMPAVSAVPTPTPANGGQTSPTPTPPSNSSASMKHHKHHKTKPQGTNEAKNITPEPPVSPIGQLSSGVSQEDDRNQSKTTTELLDGTEANLKRITRVLTADEQATVARIRNFETQSHSASDQGDPVRAHTLALKAFLLSDELVKH